MNKEAGWYSHVHPAFRIICFVILSLFLAMGSSSQIGLAAIAVAILYFCSESKLTLGLWLMLRRMRWFLLSIIIIYAWFTPGAPLFEIGKASAWLPSQAGLLDGGQRMVALVCMVAAVNWLLFVTERKQLVAALYWLMVPLELLGLSRQRFAVRVALILDRVVEVQALISREIKQGGDGRPGISAYASVAAGLVETVFDEAEQSVCGEIEIDVADVPSMRQWGWPLLLILIMLLAV